MGWAQEAAAIAQDTLDRDRTKDLLLLRAQNLLREIAARAEELTAEDYQTSIASEVQRAREAAVAALRVVQDIRE